MWTNPGNTVYKMLTTHECRNWDRGRTIIFLRKHKMNVLFSVNFVYNINVANSGKYLLPLKVV